MKAKWTAFGAVIVLVRGVGVDRLAHLPDGAADSVGGSHRVRTGGFDRGRHRGWPERLAVDGRHGTRIYLGTRQLRRA